MLKEGMQLGIKNIEQQENPLEIKAENHEQLEKELKEKMVQINFYYLMLLYQKSAESKQEKFADYLEKYDDMFAGLNRTLKNVFSESMTETETEEIIKIKIAEIKEKLNEIYRNNRIDFSGNENKDINFYFNNLKKLTPFSDYLSELIKDLEEKRKETGENQNRKKDQSGFLNYDIGNKVPELEKLGYDEETLLELQIDMLFDDKKQFNKDKIMEYLSKLACDIVDKYPQCKIIYGRSWLFDRPEMDKSIKGLHFLDDKGKINLMQFINKDNQINLKRLEYLIKNGEPEFKDLLCYIEVEDFLRMFLPKEKRS